MKLSFMKTKKPMKLTSVFVQAELKILWARAARHLGVSQSEFLRDALRGKATAALAARAPRERSIIRAAR